MDFGQLPHASRTMETSANTGEAAFGILLDLAKKQAGGLGYTALFDLILQSGQHRHGKERYENDPLTPMTYPVFDGFGKDRKVGGTRPFNGNF